MSWAGARRGGSIEAMSNSDAQPLFDGREMFMVHAVFRRELGLAPRTVRGVADGDVERARLVTGHVQGIVHMLHHHHEAEDAYTWPLLLERAADQVAPLVTLMETQHQDVAKHGDEAAGALTAFGETATASAREDLAAGLERLLTVLHEHLTTEEQQVVPLMERFVTAAEWNEMVQRGAAAADPATIPFGLGMMMYEGYPDLMDGVIANMPSDMQPVIRQLAGDAYGARAFELYGTTTPPRSTEL
jgi:hemerythrin-like domain-containing protein